MTDLELLNLCKKGDRKGQKVLFKKYNSAMTRLCYRYIKNEADTMDVVSEGFLKVFQNLNQFKYEREGGLAVWIKRIMVNECLQHLRKVRPLYENIESQEAQMESSSELWQNFDAEYIYDAILQLPEGYRTVFNLYVIEGFTHKEIAVKLGVTESASRSQLTHAKKKLQQVLQLLKV